LPGLLHLRERLGLDRLTARRRLLLLLLLELPLPALLVRIGRTGPVVIRRRRLTGARRSLTA
jgi:hypothetical protein